MDDGIHEESLHAGSVGGGGEHEGAPPQLPLGGGGVGEPPE